MVASGKTMQPARHLIVASAQLVQTVSRESQRRAHFDPDGVGPLALGTQALEVNRRTIPQLRLSKLQLPSLVVT